MKGYPWRFLVFLDIVTKIEISSSDSFQMGSMRTGAIPQSSLNNSSHNWVSSAS
jgi:hypothetical protein